MEIVFERARSLEVPRAARADGCGAPEEFAAWVYAPDGRRARARVRVEREMEEGDGRAPVCCEAALGAGAEVWADGSPAAVQFEAALRPTALDWRAVERGETPALEWRPLRPDERGLVRGIYALAAAARPCPVRASRAQWDALMERWSAAGLCAYAVERSGRAVGYALLGAPEAPEAADGARRYAELCEYAALPDGGPELREALAAACARGVCAPSGRVLGLKLERIGG